MDKPADAPAPALNRRLLLALLLVPLASGCIRRRQAARPRRPA